MKWKLAIMSVLVLGGCQSDQVQHENYSSLPQNKYENDSFDKIYQSFLRANPIDENSIKKYIHSYEELDKPYLSYRETGLPTDEIEEIAKEQLYRIFETPQKDMQSFSLVNIGEYSKDLNGFLLYRQEENTIVNATGIWRVEYNESYYSECSTKGYCGMEHDMGYYEARVAVDLKNWFIPASVEQAKFLVDEYYSKGKKLPALIVYSPEACVEGQGKSYRDSSYNDSQLITCQANIKEIYLYSKETLTTHDVPFVELKKII